MSSGRGGSGVTVVYLDRVLLLNLLVDYLLLLTTAQLAGIPPAERKAGFVRRRRGAVRRCGVPAGA
ncbi:MAG: hypothetical protein ACLUIX_00490 [Oscillospiraceae bacterium]